MNAWKSQSLTMKRIWIALAVLTAFILVHGTLTLRANHQAAFAQGVEVKIAIESIHVKAVDGTLVLFGKGTRAQADYAETIARDCIEKYARRVVNPPKDVRNEIEIGTVMTQIPAASQPPVQARVNPATGDSSTSPAPSDRNVANAPSAPAQPK